MKPPCTVSDCDRRQLSRGWCSLHYGRWRRHGHTGPYWGSAADRFWAKVNKTETCWLWTAALVGKGYGLFGRGTVAQGNVLAHRYSWEMAHGPIPDGLTVDHLCRVKACVNPGHMEIVTLAENGRRANTPPSFAV